MVARWDPDKLRAEEHMLAELEMRPLGQRLRGYFKLTGPGWLQSAMTLGSGSAAASVMSGYMFGYDLLWVQPVAMVAGVIMFAAIGNAVLATGERPYGAIRREVSGTIAFLWGIGTLASSIIWHFPQYGLIAAAVDDLADAGGVAIAGTMGFKVLVGVVVLAAATAVTWSYGSHAAGVRWYESGMRWAVRCIILAFLIVVVWTAVQGQIQFAAVARGLFAFRVPEGSTTVILGAFGAAVGINMTFLYPYSLLAKGWGKHHRGLARVDLVMSLLVPYIIATSLIVVAMAATMHDPSANVADLKRISPVQAAGALQGVFGGILGRVIFDIGLIGFAATSITAHMVVCGFTACEMFGLEYTVRRFRLFSLIPAVGVLGVALKFPLWAPIVASVICLPMLPIAYIAFIVLNNKKRYMGNLMATGAKRLIGNALILAALAATCIGIGVKFKSGVIDKLLPKTQTSAPQTESAPPTQK